MLEQHPRTAVGQREPHRGEQRGDLAVDHDGVQALLAAEVLVDDRLGDAGPGGDLLDRGAVEAALGEESPGDLDQLLAAFGRGHPAAGLRRLEGLGRFHRCGRLSRVDGARVGRAGLAHVLMMRVMAPARSSGPHQAAWLATSLPSMRSRTGHRTSLTHPNFSKIQISRAEVSSCPLSTPWRAQVGSAWWRLCQDSPIDGIASHQTFADLSRDTNGRSPIVWQIELIDQVTWCSSDTRTREPQKNPVTAPCHDQVSSPPRMAGSASETSAHSQNSLEIRTMSRSFIRSGAYLRWGVCSGSNSHIMCAWKKPLVSARRLVPYFHGECGSPSRSENLWCLRWSATQRTTGPWMAIEPATARPILVARLGLKDLWVKRRW